MEQKLISNRSAGSDMIWQQVVQIVRRSIYSGILKPGDRVVEAHLAQQLGISRNPIREGLRLMQRQGILEYRPNLGNVVANITKADIAFAFEERISIEQRAVRMLMQNEDKVTVFESLSKVLSKFAALSADAQQLDIEMIDEEFHKQIISASASKVLLVMWKSVVPYTWMFPTVYSKDNSNIRPDTETCYIRHKRLFNELLSGDVARAEAAVKAHLMEATSYIKISEA